jgi:hypothetical protein
MASVEELTIVAFDGVKLLSADLTVVDFALAGTPLGDASFAILEELAGEFDGRCRFCRFDLRRDAVASASLGILEPCVVLYESGVAVDRLRDSARVPAREAIFAMVAQRLSRPSDDDCADGSCLIPP